MKLFMIIYLAGQVGGAIGPLPYGVEECRSRADELIASADPTVETPEGYTLEDLRIACEFHEERPKLELPE